MAQKKILVVDDEIILVEFIKMRLEANGYGVITANDGVDGLLKAEEARPDLIILDISMARMDGYTMLKRIRQNEKIKSTRVIMLTASGKRKGCLRRKALATILSNHLMLRIFSHGWKRF